MSTARRDLRVDFFRGLALWWIFCDHVPGNWMGEVTLRNATLCDATEVFVLLAGYAAGLAYGGAMDRHGWLYGAADAVKRAWTLYIAHIFLFVVFTAQVAYSATALDRANYLDEINLDVLATDPYRAMLEALTLRYQPAYLNILPLYVTLLLVLAALLPLLRRPALLLCGSLAVYGLARLTGLNFPSWAGDGWFFNPLAWQVLFLFGAVLSYAPTPVLPAKPWITRASVAVLVFGFVTVAFVWDHPDTVGRLPPWLASLLLDVDKTGLHPFRLASILALLWLATRLIAPGAAWLRSRAASAPILAGQHSLPVFCAGIFLSFLGRIAMEESDGAPVQAAVNLGGVAAMIAVAAVAAWYKTRGRGEPAASPARTLTTAPFQ